VASEVEDDDNDPQDSLHYNKKTHQNLSQNVRGTRGAPTQKLTRPNRIIKFTIANSAITIQDTHLQVSSALRFCSSGVIIGGVTPPPVPVVPTGPVGPGPVGPVPVVLRPNARNIDILLPPSAIVSLAAGDPGS
jgi:hypothetical protein